MVTEFLRDSLFSAAWFGLMAMVWLGWAQEAPPARLRPWLGAGSVLGVLLAAGGGVLVGLNWREPTALADSYVWFGVLVGTEVVAAGVGCAVLAVRGRKRWMAWWVAIVVALHFIPLAVLLADVGMALLGIAQAVVLVAFLPRLRAAEVPTSVVAGPVMGFSILGAAVIAGASAASRLLAA